MRCCCLCCTTCDEYKLLQNDFGESNSIYEITVNYFDPMLLTEHGNANSHHAQVLCQRCWFHINDFHKFQQTVLKSRLLWEGKELKTLSTQVKQEDDQADENEHMPHNEKLDRSKDKKDQFDKYLDFKTESLLSCEDTLKPKLKECDVKNKQQSLTLEHENQVKDDLTTKTRRGRMQKNNNDCIEEKKKGKKHKLTNSAKDKETSALNVEKTRESDAFIAEWKPELVCDLCSDTATNFDKLRIHFKEKHDTRLYIKCCERKFFRRSVLVNHIQLHLNPETHKCDICGKSSSTKHNLKLHKKLMHEDTKKQLKCDICGKLFKRKVTLEQHLLTHATGSKDFICPECGKGYVLEQLLKLHIKHVHNADRVCDQCGKTIHGFQALKKHLMEHAGIERPKFPCDICGLELKSPNGLKRHKASYHNDGSTIYVCGVCGKVAASENALRNHKKIVHLKERNHKCTYCDKAFKSPKSLREHIATHTGQDLYQCPHCSQTFKVSANMHHHRKRVHPVEWEEGRKNRLQHPNINISQVKKQVVI